MARCSCRQSTALTLRPRCFYAHIRRSLYLPRGRPQMTLQDDRTADEMPSNVQTHRFVPEGRQRVAIYEQASVKNKPGRFRDRSNHLSGVVADKRRAT